MLTQENKSVTRGKEIPFTRGNSEMLTHEDTLTRATAYRSHGKPHIAHARKSISLTRDKEGKMPNNACSGPFLFAHFMRKSIKCANRNSLSPGEPRSSAAADAGVRPDGNPLTRGNSEMLTHEDTLTREKQSTHVGKKKMLTHEISSRGQQRNAHA